MAIDAVTTRELMDSRAAKEARTWDGAAGRSYDESSSRSGPFVELATKLVGPRRHGDGGPATALREAALGDRRLERSPTPQRGGANSAAGQMNHGDDRWEQHRGKDHENEEDREQILGHLFVTFLSEWGGNRDLNICDLVFPKCLESGRHPPLPIGPFSSAERGKSTQWAVSNHRHRPTAPVGEDVRRERRRPDGMAVVPTGRTTASSACTSGVG